MADENKIQEMMNCPYCGEEIAKGAKKCKHCGEWLEGSKSNANDIINKEALPEEYKKFNWGAFLTSWIWGIANKSYLTFFAFLSLITWIIPIVGTFIPIGLSIWFGVKGNEWAWQNKEWKSLEHFNEVQRKWAMWSAIGIACVFAFAFIIIILCTAIAATSGAF